MGDSYSADVGQHIDENGRVTYDFNGHVGAQGVDLLAGNTDTPPDDRRVRWLLESDGTAIAELYSYAPPGGGHGVVVRVDDDTYGHAAFEARAGQNIERSEVVAEARDAGGLGQDVRIIDSDAQSSFVGGRFFGPGQLQLSVFDDTLEIFDDFGPTPALTLTSTVVQGDSDHVVAIYWDYPGIFGRGELVFTVDGEEINRLPHA